MSMMTNFLKMIALNGSAAERAELKAMLEGAADTAVVERPARKGKGKRTLSPEQKAKMAEGRRRAAAERAEPATKPGKAQAAKPAAERPLPPLRKKVEIRVEDYTTKRTGENGTLVVIGSASAFCAKGDEAKRRWIIDTFNLIRTMPHEDMARIMAKIGR